MSAKYSFHLENQDRRRELPTKIIIGRGETETEAHVLLKLFAFALFHRPRLQIEANLHNDNIPFVPDLVELDYELRPRLWIECGECSVGKLHKLAVKVPDAEIWVIKRNPADTEHLLRSMEKEELRHGHYRLLSLDPEMFAEVLGLLRGRNEMLWVEGKFDPPEMRFDFNGLWFEAPFSVREY
jgi:uncharacterized protein YaeQ